MQENSQMCFSIFKIADNQLKVSFKMLNSLVLLAILVSFQVGGKLHVKGFQFYPPSARGFVIGFYLH